MSDAQRSQRRPYREVIERAIVASWGSDTHYASERYMALGRPGDPARGQCGATALVVQDLLGGDLLVGDALVGSERLGVHYWNRLEDREVLDLSSGQFVEGEVVADARVVHRPPGLPPHGAQAYLLLRKRVAKIVIAAGDQREETKSPTAYMGGLRSVIPREGRLDQFAGSGWSGCRVSPEISDSA